MFGRRGGNPLGFFVGSCIFASGALAKMQTHQSPFSKIEIRSECLESYQKGQERYQSAIESTARAESFEELLVISDRRDEACRQEFALGAMDARFMHQQLLSLEFLLERDYLLEDKGFSETLVMPQVIALFRERFQHAYHDPQSVELLMEQGNEFEGRLEDFKREAFSKARALGRAIPIGRFVFAPHPREKLRTLHDFERQPNGVALMHGDEFQLKEGSYVVAIKKLWELTQEVAIEYLEWEPSRWFGEDSWVYGAAWRYYFGDRDAPSIREIKEQHYMDMMDNFIRWAGNYGMPLKPFFEVQKVMLDKQRAYLERDIATIKAVKTGSLFAPFIPAAIYLGAIGLGYAGLSASTAGSFTLSTGAYLSAANVAAASSLIALSGATVWRSIEQYKVEKPKGFVGFLDTLLPNAISSFPLAAITPITIGTLAASTKFLVIEGKAFLAHMSNGFQSLKSMGFKGSIRLAPNLPKFLAKKWLSHWWIRDTSTGVLKFRTGLASYYLANNAASLISEYVDRQYWRDDPSEKFFVDGKINEKSIYRLVPGAIMGLIATPLLTTKNFFSRFLAWRVIDFVGATGVTYAVKKEVDGKYVSFEMLYGATAGNLMGEASRVVSLAVLNSQTRPELKFVLETLFRLASVFPKTYVRNTFLHAYYDGKELPALVLRQILLDEMKISLENFSDEELLEAVEDFFADPQTELIMEWLRDDALTSP